MGDEVHRPNALHSSAGPPQVPEQMPISPISNHFELSDLSQGERLVNADGISDNRSAGSARVTDAAQQSAPRNRETTGPAIGPASDLPSPDPKTSEHEGPILYITLLLTTGARHPFQLDQKYLRKRNVDIEADDPANISLYQLKELILRDWRDEWEVKPLSPDSIRLISMGRLLSDKSKLSDFGFKSGEAPMIVHMSVKPQEIVDEEEANKSARDRESHEKKAGCRCMVM